MLNKILTARDHVKNYEAYIQRHVKIRYKIVTPIDWSNPSGLPVRACILRGSWVAACECGECVWYEPGKAFFCPNCLNAENKHQPRPVIMPTERPTIEALLLIRPNPQNRNWLIGEPIDQLIAENIEHEVVQ